MRLRHASQVLNRFVNAGRIMIYRYRADKRLVGLAEMMRLAQGNADTLAGGVLVSQRCRQLFMLHMVAVTFNHCSTS